ncbi:shikimate kinase [Parafilimonas sp.]|uniref:shikimate kinase n=1 Tax=Parafilimonas sp. TaxID=1969739 RepID=UPI0039E2F954
MKIFLIGLMGSGKSYWAYKISKTLDIPAFDLDAAIESAEGKTIAEIFAEKGESYFRLKENEILKSFAQKENFILAAGGGAPCFHDNMEWMNANGITIWIDEPVSVIAARLQKEKSHRPLIANVADEALESFFYEMRNKRRPFYSSAKYHLNSGDLAEKHFLEILSPS